MFHNRSWSSRMLCGSRAWTAAEVIPRLKTSLLGHSRGWGHARPRNLTARVRPMQRSWPTGETLMSGRGLCRRRGWPKRPRCLATVEVAPTQSIFTARARPTRDLIAMAMSRIWGEERRERIVHEQRGEEIADTSEEMEKSASMMRSKKRWATDEEGILKN